jgi:hypothetical protein
MKAGHILSSAGVGNLHLLTGANHPGHILKGNITAVSGIVEPPVAVFFQHQGISHVTILYVTN